MQERRDQHSTRSHLFRKRANASPFSGVRPQKMEAVSQESISAK